ncbi:hypothetical protein HU763_000695 [Pseudomonas anuradhapurensis]|uniref:hypothetical protein n=1 Tax=Pseudomonas anuradhapurensis TaxID=485870 RepID=UPI001646A2D3|nr:hypothetical protein [Pseudomonas anuradhapurensis]QXI50390.1 hypothetical protein HU763_000695 [Pseudomonas anuradhapurensis]
MLTAWIVAELDSTDFGFHAALSSSLWWVGGEPPFELVGSPWRSNAAARQWAWGLRHLTLGQPANGRLESILSKQFFGLHSYQAMPGCGCFSFVPVGLHAEAHLQHSLPSHCRQIAISTDLSRRQESGAGALTFFGGLLVKIHILKNGLPSGLVAQVRNAF